MPTVLPDRALDSIELVVNRLLDGWTQLPSPIQEHVEALYARMHQESSAAQNESQRGMAVARFLAAIDELPEVHALIGATIELMRSVPRPGDEPLRPSAALDRLPPSLAGARAQVLMASPELPDFELAEATEPPATSGPMPLEAIAPPAPQLPVAAPDANGGGSAAGLTRELHTGPPAAPPLPAPAAPAPAAPLLPPSVIEPAAGGVGTSLTRYPALEYPREVVLGTRTSLTVVLELQQREPQSVAVFVADTAPQPPVLEVVLRARAFDIEHSNTQLLEVSRDGDCDVRFVLVPRQPGEHELRVDFYQHGRRIGTARHTARVVEQAAALPVRSRLEALEPLEIGAAGAVAPDLELCVQADRNDQQVLYFSLHSTVEDVDLHHTDAGSVRLHGSPLQKMQQVYDQLSRYAGQAPSGQNERLLQLAELERIGRNLWDELVSDELKAGYWLWKDRIRSLLITSDEPWIPWEIVKPYRWDDQNRLVDEPFWCEKFCISRWLSGPGPADRVPMQLLRPVAPAASNLASVHEELQFLRSINQLNRGVSADEPFSQRGPVLELFSSGRFNVLHIAAHGGFNALQPDDSRIMLDGGELRPADIFARFGGARPRPLVFINACHGARLEHAFTGLGGWADRLVRNAKVGAFIGTAWEVNDRLALLFAQAFYEALLRDGKTLGESFLLARLRIRDAEPSNSTWLAYVLYADPGAHAALASNGATV